MASCEMCNIAPCSISNERFVELTSSDIEQVACIHQSNDCRLQQQGDNA